jgi:hypothetical protein
MTTKSGFPELTYRPPRGPDVGPVDSSLELFQKVYRDPNQPIERRLRAARDAKDHEHPKLVATAIVNEGSFAALLDRAIARSNGHKVIEGEKVLEPAREGSLMPKTSETREVSAEHQRKPIKSFLLTRRV